MTKRRENLARLREERGFSQEQLAELVGVDVGNVSRWERGATRPRTDKRRPLAHALGISLVELAALLRLTSIEDDDERDSPNLPGPARSESCGSELHSDQDALAADERVAHALLQPTTTDTATVAALRQQVHRLSERYDRMPSMSLLAETGQVLGQLGVLSQNSFGDSVDRELRAVEATAATLMGQLVWDASQRRDHRTARHYFTHACAAARDINDPIAEGHALLRTSYLALYGQRDPVEGLRLTQETTEAARNSNVLTGLAQLHSAEAHAMLGETRDCELTLAAAENSLGRVAESDEAAHLISATQYRRLAGSCYLALGDYRRAQGILDDASKTMRAPSKSKAIVLGNLTLAHLNQRELDAALFSLHDAIDVLEATRGGGGLTIVADAARTLRRWRSEPQVQEVYDRMLSLMTAA